MTNEKRTNVLVPRRFALVKAIWDYGNDSVRVLSEVWQPEVVTEVATQKQERIIKNALTQSKDFDEAILQTLATVIGDYEISKTNKLTMLVNGSLAGVGDWIATIIDFMDGEKIASGAEQEALKAFVDTSKDALVRTLSAKFPEANQEQIWLLAVAKIYGQFSEVILPKALEEVGKEVYQLKIPKNSLLMKVAQLVSMGVTFRSIDNAKYVSSMLGKYPDSHVYNNLEIVQSNFLSEVSKYELDKNPLILEVEKVAKVVDIVL